MPMPVVASRTNATRTTRGSCRRCTAVPTATPAMARPDRGRTSGGGGGGGAPGGGAPIPRPPPPPPRPPPLEPPVWQPPPPPPGAWARPQLRRSRSDKVIGGVGGGLAEYSGIDALL